MPARIITSDDEDDLMPPVRTPTVKRVKDEDDDDAPVVKKVKKETPKATKATPTKKTATPTKKTATPTKKTTTTKTTTKVKKESGTNSKTPVKKTTTTTIKKDPVKKQTVKKTTVKKETVGADGKVKKEETEEAEDVYKWWENDNQDDSIKWETLEHKGVMFPPEYEPLPKSVLMKYEGTPVVLPEAAEEVAGFFGAMLETDHAKNPTFQKNFFNDFKDVLKECGGAKDKQGNKVPIKAFSKCDFSDMYAHFEKLREEKKAMSAVEKKAIKAERDKIEEPFKVCLLNGRKEQVGNFRIEPPGLFRGRGAHPKTGKLKRRVLPEQITINIGKGCPVPEPPAGHKWAEVRHDNSVAWLAMWHENINNSIKYVLFAANSSLKGMSDYKKFEKARELKKHVGTIRKDYEKELKSEAMFERQRATAMYLIDVLALRAGGEKGDDEADTVGCCSLRYEHITLSPPNIVEFDFLGKDSIRYHQEVEVSPQVFKNLRIFKKEPKKVGDDIFDRLDPSVLNKHLQNYMPGLTAKVFRTYNASKTMDDQLSLIPNEGTVAEKLVKFNAANRAVAILCNHQKTVSKTHGESVGKIEDRINEVVWQKWRHKRMLLDLEPKLLKKEPKLFADLDELSKEERSACATRLLEKDTERWTKKFERDNEKLVAEKQKPKPKSELNAKLKDLADTNKQYLKEVKSNKVEGKGTVEKLRAQVEKLETRVATMRMQLKDKEDNSSVALGTSKMNYIDPRLTVKFSKKYDVPIEKLFTKTLRDKFQWAIQSADEDWEF
ncbi:DNA topoisomerase 1 [Yarrowia sp. C11]|nr:DNA topoisomerase 1 [Yarrowia sp. C11]KAG5359399.1 DNA topoisomerase 1 [Yarrowia sp. E02]